MHHEIKQSGLGKMFCISNRVKRSDPRIKFLNCRVRYKQTRKDNPEFVRANGTIILTETFLIKELQNDYEGKPMLRGYFKGDTFGRVIDPKDVEIISTE